MQEEGLDTVDANRQLGLPDDAREYTSLVNILAGLNIKSIQLIVRPPFFPSLHPDHLLDLEYEVVLH